MLVGARSVYLLDEVEPLGVEAAGGHVDGEQELFDRVHHGVRATDEVLESSELRLWDVAVDHLGADPPVLAGPAIGRLLEDVYHSQRWRECLEFGELLAQITPSHWRLA